MTALELSLAFALGIATLLAVLWLINLSRKTAALFLLNSLIASGVLMLCSRFAAGQFKLNAFSLFTTALLGFVGIAAVYMFNR